MVNVGCLRVFVVNSIWIYCWFRSFLLILNVIQAYSQSENLTHFSSLGRAESAVHCQQLLIVFYRCNTKSIKSSSMNNLITVAEAHYSFIPFSSVMLVVYSLQFPLVVLGVWPGISEDYQMVIKIRSLFKSTKSKSVLFPCSQVHLICMKCQEYMKRSVEISWTLTICHCWIHTWSAILWLFLARL